MENFDYETYFLKEGFFIPQYTGEHDQENLHCRPTIQTASESNEADSQCLKYFHWIKIKSEKENAVHYGEQEIQLHAFWTSALNANECPDLW
jgi:hypothetical protein